MIPRHLPIRPATAQGSDSAGGRAFDGQVLFQKIRLTRHLGQMNAAICIDWHQPVPRDCDVLGGLGQQKYWNVFGSCAAADIDSVRVAAVRTPAKQDRWKTAVGEKRCWYSLGRVYLGRSSSAMNWQGSSPGMIGRAAPLRQERYLKYCERTLLKTIQYAGSMSMAYRMVWEGLIAVCSSELFQQMR